MILDPDKGVLPLRPLAFGVGEEKRVSEATIRDIIVSNAACLPIGEIDSQFEGAFAVCSELNTSAGPIDALLLTRSGLPILVECKLWRNPESRREVVGQIIDYAKELSQWSCSDLQREVAKRLSTGSDALLRLVRQHFPDIDEASFNDDLTRNLRRGRFLLLIVGDGIREGVEAIAEYVQRHAGLHFTLGLVELPLFECPDGRLLVAPRVVAHTKIISRTVVEAGSGLVVNEEDTKGEPALAVVAPTQPPHPFWIDFLEGLALDDPEQPKPKPSRQGYLSFMLPAPQGSSWITVYRDSTKRTVGLFLSYSRNSIGERATLRVLEDIDRIRPEIGPEPQIEIGKDGRHLLSLRRSSESPDTSEVVNWLRARTNEFVSAFRPRIRAAVNDIKRESDG